MIRFDAPIYNVAYILQSLRQHERQRQRKIAYTSKVMDNVTIYRLTFSNYSESFIESSYPILTYPTCICRPLWGDPVRNVVEIFGIRKLESINAWQIPVHVARPFLCS